MLEPNSNHTKIARVDGCRSRGSRDAVEELGKLIDRNEENGCDRSDVPEEVRLPKSFTLREQRSKE